MNKAWNESDESWKCREYVLATRLGVTILASNHLLFYFQNLGVDCPSAVDVGDSPLSMDEP
jgi:hypothetical protein